MAVSGGSGGGMMDWVALGRGLQDDTLESMSYFQQLAAARNARADEKEMLAENKRRWDIESGRDKQATGMNALQMLANSRSGAQSQANLRSFRDGLFTGGK